MYKRILLASDGSRQTLVALREGALIARTFAARSHLLIVDGAGDGWATADGVSMLPLPSNGPELLQLGLTRLSRLGVEATGELLKGDPAELICRAARRMRADLIIIGHRRQTFVERWWSGSSGSYIIDNVHCSVMIARESISDEEFEKYLSETAEGAKAGADDPPV